MKISLEAFLQKQQYMLEAFAKNWTVKAVGLPDDYPSHLSEADWEEQLVCFSELKLNQET
jgi:hypothetical protein